MHHTDWTRHHTDWTRHHTDWTRHRADLILYQAYRTFVPGGLPQHHADWTWVPGCTRLYIEWKQGQLNSLLGWLDTNRSAGWLNYSSWLKPLPELTVNWELYLPRRCLNIGLSLISSSWLNFRTRLELNLDSGPDCLSADVTLLADRTVAVDLKCSTRSWYYWCLV
jgi:hypothetical protein